MRPGMRGNNFRWPGLQVLLSGLTGNGKPYAKGTNTISADGKAFKEINWLVTKPAET